MKNRHFSFNTTLCMGSIKPKMAIQEQLAKFQYNTLYGFNSNTTKTITHFRIVSIQHSVWVQSYTLFYVQSLNPVSIQHSVWVQYSPLYVPPFNRCGFNTTLCMGSIVRFRSWTKNRGKFQYNTLYGFNSTPKRCRLTWKAVSIQHSVWVQ